MLGLVLGADRAPGQAHDTCRPLTSRSRLDQGGLPPRGLGAVVRTSGVLLWGERDVKLYSAPLSLFARKVEIALREKGLAFERVMVPFSQERGYAPKHPDVLAANPKGQVPVLVDGDLALFVSTVILEYLEDAFPDPPLYPASPRAHAECRLLELFADEGSWSTSTADAPQRAAGRRCGAPNPVGGGWLPGRGRPAAALGRARGQAGRPRLVRCQLLRSRHCAVHGRAVRPTPAWAEPR